MAIDPRIFDPRISLQTRVPDVGQAINVFQNALTSGQNRRVQQQQADRQAELAPIQLQQAQQNIDINQGAIDEQTENRIIRSIAEFGTKLKPVLESGNTEQAIGMLMQRARDLQSQKLPVDETVDAIQALQQGDSQGVLDNVNIAQQIAQQRGLFGASNVSVKQMEFNDNVAAVKADPNLETIDGKSAAIALGLEARASTSAQERIANDTVLTTAVASSEAEIEGAKSVAREGGKLEQQLKHLPSIRKEIKLAEKAATERGDVLSSLERSKAALPGLLDAVDQLKELAPIATSTFGGKIFDSAIKQTGFGATKGSTARAKFIAIINNQVLPLLKETFGAAFTAQEGESLKATMGDPDASPAEKMVQLEAFINQKQRDIETREAQLGQEQKETIPKIIRFDAQGNQI